MGSTQATITHPKRQVLVRPPIKNSSVQLGTVSGLTSAIKQADKIEFNEINVISGRNVLSSCSPATTSSYLSGEFNSSRNLADCKCLSQSNNSVYTSIDNTNELDSIENSSENSFLSFENEYSEITSSDRSGDPRDEESKNNTERDSLIIEYNFSSNMMKKRTNSYENFVLIEKNNRNRKEKNASESANCFKNNDEIVILNVMNIKKLKNMEKSYL